MFDFEVELKRDLQRIERAPAHWTETPIGNWPNKNGLAREAARITAPPDWWTRIDSAQTSAIAQVTALLNRAGRAVDNMRQERRTAAQGELDDEVSVDSLAPDENESISDWLGRLGTRIDSNGRRKALWAGLRGYVSRFHGDAKAKTTLDKKLVRRFLQHALG